MSQDFGSSSASGTGSTERHVPELPDLELLRLIGRGGYGEVWLARNVMGTYRAVKVVYRSTFSEDRPFDREFEGIKQFEPLSREHPGLVDVLRVGRDEQRGLFYYVMELADDAADVGSQQPGGDQPGVSVNPPHSAPKPIDPASYTPRTLRSLLHPSPGKTNSPPDGRCCLPVRQCLEIALELASALDYLHKKGLVHRDVKPSNIIFVNGVAKLADIGLVAAAGEERSFVGTEGFVPPEGPGRPQADIFALGKVLYEMLTGFGARDYPKVPVEWAGAPDRDEINEMNQVVLRACEGDSQRRYTTAAQMRLDLDLLINGKSLAIRRLQRTIFRLRWIIAGVAGMVLFILSITGFWFFKNRAAEQDRRRELREIQISLTQPRNMGWFSNDWSRLERVAAIRKDQELLEQASSLLAGWDCRLLNEVEGAAASSGVFAPDGRVLVAGLGQSPALLIDTNGVTTELALRGEGPLCWTPQNIPVQLTVISNRLVLRESLTGIIRRQFSLGGPDLSLTNGTPVLAISPNGEKVAAAVPSRVLVWNAGTGKLIGEASTEATAMAFTPDGSLLGVGDAGGTNRVYSLPSLAEIAVLRPALRGNPISCLAFSRDRLVPYRRELGTNSWLLAAGDQGAGIVVWDLERRMPRSFCRGSVWTVAALAISPDGLTLASSGRNLGRLWDISNGRPLLLLPGTGPGNSTVLNFDAAGRRLISGGSPGVRRANVHLWELDPDHGLQGFPGLASPVRKVWFSKNSELVAALSDDWHLGVWGVSPRRLVYIFETPVGDFADSAGGCFDASGTHFAVSAGREACLYDLATSRVEQWWELKEGLFDDLQWDVQGRLLLLRRERVSELRNPVWRLYSLGHSSSPLLLHQQTETNWVVRDVALPKGARRFLVWSGGPKGVVRVLHAYDTETGRELWKVATEKFEGDLRVCLEPRGELFGYTYSPFNNRLRLVRFSDFAELGTTAEDCEAIAPSGRQFAFNGGFFPDTSGIRHVIPLIADYGGASPPAFSPNGRLLAWGRSDGMVFVVDTEVLQRRLSPLMP